MTRFNDAAATTIRDLVNLQVEVSPVLTGQGGSPSPPCKQALISRLNLNRFTYFCLEESTC